MAFPGFLFATIVGVGFVAFVWRLGSRRQSLPCPVWLRWLVELDNPFTKTNRASFIVKTLSLADGMQVLDAGCGPGRLIPLLAHGVGTAGNVVAMDIQSGMLARAKAKVEAAGYSNVEYVLSSLGTGALRPNAFDRIVMVTVLGEIPNREAAMAELSCALKPEGILAIVEVIFDPHFQTRKTVTALGESVGLRERAFFGHGLAYVIHFAKSTDTLVAEAHRTGS